MSWDDVVEVAGKASPGDLVLIKFTRPIDNSETNRISERLTELYGHSGVRFIVYDESDTELIRIEKAGTE